MSVFYKSQATLDQLKVFAQAVLGLELTGSETKAELRNLIDASGHDGDKIEIPDDLGVVERPVVKRTGTYRPGKDGHEEVKILIHVNEGIDGERPVPVAVNGVVLAIPRGTEEWVPVHYVEALEQAKQLYRGTDRDGRFVGEGRMVSRFPFSYV